MSLSNGRKVLLVRHGRNRGPHIRLRPIRPEYFEPFLTDQESLPPGGRQSLDVWSTGTKPPKLENVAAVVFLLQDPLRFHSQSCYEEAKQLEAQARALGIRIVNPPDAISVHKSEHTQLWQSQGLQTPDVAPFDSYEELLEVAQGVEFPTILKHDLLHAQSKMKYVSSLNELEGIPQSEIPCPGSLCSFIDVRAGYQESEPDSAFAEYFHKKRALIFGRHVRTNHLFFSRNPIVGSKTSTFAHGRSLNPIKRWFEVHEYRDHFRLDWEYWAKGSEHGEELRSAAQVLELDFVAIDYSTLSDGHPMLWEANPHFALHVWPFGIYSRQRKLKSRIASLHSTFAKFLLELAEGS